MERTHLMALDVHCQSCEFAAATPGGRIVDRRHLPTTIPSLVEAVRSVRRPRVLVMEEGPLADWLARELAPEVDQVIVCDPRRNHLIAKDGDKDDPIDAAKLLELARGNHLRAVHHPETAGRAIFKMHVALYHDRVRERVRAALHVIGFTRRFGVIIDEGNLADEDRRAAVVLQLPGKGPVREDLALLLRHYDSALEVEAAVRRRLEKTARRIAMVRRFTQLPGVGWIRAATFYAVVDTPCRFRSKQALWKYMGIGLERHRSGSGKTLNHLGVPRRCNFPLKDMILGAARSAVASHDNPFADQYRRYIQRGWTPRIAVRTTARTMAAVMLGMWKTERDYRPDWVGRSAADLATQA
jgi:transposase